MTTGSHLEIADVSNIDAAKALQHRCLATWCNIRKEYGRCDKQKTYLAGNHHATMRGSRGNQVERGFESAPEGRFMCSTWPWLNMSHKLRP